MPTRRTRVRLFGWEALGILLAAALALVALAHTLAGAKRSLLLNDGDSVLLPLMLRSFERGEPFQWGMSPVLFVFPEFPLYAGSAAVTATVSGALLLNGVLNVVLLYVLLRYVAGRVIWTRRSAEDPAPHPVRPVGAAILGVIVVVGLILLETRPGGNTGEIASLYLTTTYYSGTVMALVATVGLVLHLAGPLDGRGRRILLPALAIGVLAAVSTLSNPLYLLWVTVPLAAALAVLSVLRWRGRVRDPWWRPAATVVALLAGTAAGYLARRLLGDFIIADKTLYFRYGLRGAGVTFDVDTVRTLVATPGGAVEAVVAAVLLVGALVAAVAAVVRRGTGSATLAALVAGFTVILVPPVLIWVGSISTRYALPLLFTPVLLLVAGAAAGPRRAAAARVATSRSKIRERRIIGTAAFVVTVVVAALTVPSSVSVARVAAGSGDPVVSCLANWARGKDVTGVAQFWTGRGLQTYGGADVNLLQVNGDFSVYPWLVNLAAYKNARVSYVVVATGVDSSGHTDYWGDDVTNLGAPRDIVRCGSYDIYDFRGLPAATAITQKVDQSAAVQAAFRGFGW